MKKTISILLLSCSGLIAGAQQLIPLPARVNIQQDTAAQTQIIDGQWVGVGTKKKHSIQRDFTLLFEGKPSYRFELKADDNTLQGYAEGETKGRAELSYCYATSEDFRNHPELDYSANQICKTVYHHGKGSYPQGSNQTYQFSVYIPSDLSSKVQTIFAQWHGMPDRTLVRTPEGEVKQLTQAEFCEIEKNMIFKKDAGHEKIAVNKKENAEYKAGKANGWLVEQGGYPPLAFGFANDFFYIKANSDRKWMSDKTDRCNTDPAKVEIMQPRTSTYKSSVIAYKMPFADFPKDCWVTFVVNTQWSVYGKEKENIVKDGQLDVTMTWQNKKGKTISKHIVDHANLAMGRNDEAGYYFKFGIYRVGNSTEPVRYNLANFKTM